MEIPEIGTNIRIVSLKHDRIFHRRWEENIVLYSDENIVIGGNDQTTVKESEGKKWRTSEPAIFYFDRRYWFNIIIIIGSDNHYYYCNLSSPFTYKNKEIQYIDYDIDIIVHSDFTYKVVDLAEYEEHKRKFHYPVQIQQAINWDLHVLQNWIKQHKDPFNKSFLDYWFTSFLNRR